MTECAWYPESRTLLVMNNSDQPLDVKVFLPIGEKEIHTEAFGMTFTEI